MNEFPNYATSRVHEWLVNGYMEYIKNHIKAMRQAGKSKTEAIDMIEKTLRIMVLNGNPIHQSGLYADLLTSMLQQIDFRFIARDYVLGVYDE